MKVLVTGGAGFIASFVVDRILKTTDWDIVLVSKSLSHHGQIRLAGVDAVNNPRVQFIRADISAGIPPIQDVDYVLHMGAESHVDVSISEPERHIRSNVIGTYKMLEYAKELPSLKKFLYFSTDEVYGSAKPGETFTEWSRYNSGNPYAATKAAAEELCLAWENTYKVPVVITHSMNVFGERQKPSSAIPLFIKRILDGKTITIHLDAEGNSVVRSFVYGDDVAEAALRVLESGAIRQKYGIKGAFETPISVLANRIADLCGKKVTLEYKYPSVLRPGVDTRYSVGGTNMKDELGWEPSTDTDAQLKKSVDWYIEHAEEWYVDRP
jgi:dTDP-glucose 4,6-dehydratase